MTAGETGFTRLPYPITGKEWTPDLLINGATYEYKLQSVSGLIEGGLSNTVRVTPTGPAPVAPTLSIKAGNRKAVLTWNLPDHATNVYIHVRNVTAGETGFTRLPYPVYDDKWTATQLVNGATYQFKVQAYNDLIQGGTSSAVTVKPTGPAPAGPENLTATARKPEGDIELGWCLTGHRLRHLDPGGHLRGRLEEAAATRIADDTVTAGMLVNGATYEFKVQSRDGLNAGGYSNTGLGGAAWPDTAGEQSAGDTATGRGTVDLDRVEHARRGTTSGNGT